MDKYIYDKRNGLWYELQGDYYIPCLELPAEKEERHIGVWGQRHRRYLKANRMALYTSLLTSGKLNSYLADIDRQAEEMFSRLVKQLSEKENCFCIKVYPLSSWCGRWDLNPYVC